MFAELNSVMTTFTEKAASGKLDVGFDVLAIEMIPPPEPYVPPSAEMPAGERQQIVLRGESANIGDNIRFNISFNGETSMPLPVDATDASVSTTCDTAAAAANSVYCAISGLASVGSVDVQIATNVTAAGVTEIKWIVRFTLADDPLNQGDLPLMEVHPWNIHENVTLTVEELTPGRAAQGDVYEEQQLVVTLTDSDAATAAALCVRARMRI